MQALPRCAGNWAGIDTEANVFLEGPGAGGGKKQTNEKGEETKVNTKQPVVPVCSPHGIGQHTAQSALFAGVYGRRCGTACNIGIWHYDDNDTQPRANLVIMNRTIEEVSINQSRQSTTNPNWSTWGGDVVAQLNRMDTSSTCKSCCPGHGRQHHFVCHIPREPHVNA